MEIGPELRSQRLQTELKQGDVALAAGLTVWRLLRIEKGLVQPTDAEVAAIRQALQRLGTIEAQRRAAIGRKS